MPKHEIDIWGLAVLLFATGLVAALLRFAGEVGKGCLRWMNKYLRREA